MTNYQPNHRGASAPVLLATLAITPILFSSCLSKSDRETIEIPPASVGEVVKPLDATTMPATAAVPDAIPAEPPYSLDDAVKYVIQDGDTLSTIAAKHDVSVSDVKLANKIANANKIRSGQMLLLPGAAAEANADEPTGTNSEVSGEIEAGVRATEGASGLNLPGVSGE